MNVMVWFSQQDKLLKMMDEQAQADLQEEAREMADYGDEEEEEDVLEDYQVIYDW